MNSVIFFLIGLSAITFLTIPFIHAEQGPYHDSMVIGVNEEGEPITQVTVYTHERINNNGQYDDYIFTDYPNSLQVETMVASVTLDKTTCGFSFHNKGYINENPTPLFSDSIVGYSSVVDLYTWNEVGTLNSATCESSWDGQALTAKKFVAGLGLMEYKYVFTKGSWKTQLEVTNLSALTDRVFGFDQTINLNRDTVFFAGNMRNLDNYHNTTFDRTWLENNEGDVVNFLNGYAFDLDIGFDYLDSITVIDNGADSSQLVFHYMRNNEILLPNDTLIIDPTYGPTLEDADGRIQSQTGTTGTACNTTYNTVVVGTITAYLPHTGSTGECIGGYLDFDVSSVPAGSIVSSASLEYDVTAVTNGRNCVWKHASTQPPDGQNSLDDIYGGTEITTASSTCTTVADGKTVSLNAAGLTALEGDLSQGSFGMYIFYDNQVRGGSSATTELRANDATLTFEHEPGNVPDAVDDLTSTGQTYGSVDLVWTEPYLNSGNLTGYQVNYTTPWGDPNTIITNNTGTNDVTATVSGLSIATDYSFRIGVWTESSNMTGNILNVTTQGNFTIGTATFNQTNTQVLPITFEEQSINSTAKFLNVTYANTYTLSCDFHYKFANTNQTYSGLTGTAVSSTLDETSFIFTDFDNEIIDVYCWDTVTNTDGDYLLIQNDFPLLQQIASFRAGDYGTDGKIGVFDFITIAVIIFSMIGLNRVNESVGAVFNIALLGGLAYFEIIELPTIIFGIIAVVLVFAITSTRKT